MNKQLSKPTDRSSPSCSSREPKKILWLVGGNQENESLIPLFSGLVKQLPWECRNVLITNCRNHKQFPGETYLSKYADYSNISLLEKYRGIVLNAYEEGLLAEADIVVTGGMTAAVLVLLLDLQNGRYRERPIVYVSPKVPEKTVAEFAAGSGHEDIFWWLTGKLKNLHVVVLDNDTEKQLAEDRLAMNFPNTSKAVRRLVTYKYDKIGHCTKEDIVVWSGRFNAIKNPGHALKVIAVLEGLATKCSMFVVSNEINKRKELQHASTICSGVHLNLNSEEYINLAKRARVLLITSEVEGFPLGYIELIDKGVVPVIRKKHWMRTFLTEKWPLVYVKEGEAVEMCQDALKNYDKYVTILESCLSERYSKELNWAVIMEDIWSSYVSLDYRHDYSPDSNRKFKVK